MRRLALLGMLAVTAGIAAAWWSGGPNVEEIRLADPPYLKEPVAARSLAGEKLDFLAPASGAAVVVFYSRDRPLSASALTSLARLADETPRHRLFLAGVDVGADAGADDQRRDAPLAPALATIAPDRDGRLARQFGVTRLPEAFVLDDGGRLRYRGCINDDSAEGQGGDRGDSAANQARPEAGVRPAVEAVLAGRPTAPPAPAPADGPPLTLPVAQGDDPPVPTFHRDVAPILQRSCRPCHQPGQSGPFPLTTYRHAAKRADDLATVVAERLMPPWKPRPGVGPPLKHDRTLLPAEIETLQRWAQAGAPEGSPAKSPALAPAAAAGGWSLGPPDLVVESDEPFSIPASGDDVYRCFVLPTDLPADRFLTAIEVQPGNPRVVHHTFGYVDTRGLGRQRDAQAPGPGYPCFSGFAGDQIFGLLGGWTPGNDAHPFGEGIGLELPRRADLVMQIHYHPSGKPETDRTRFGLYFSKSPARQALEWVSACPDLTKFRLPADDPDIQVVANLEVPIPVALHAMTPHMHWLGRRFRASVRTPDGRVRPLIAIDDWDFNRQDTYYLRDPLSIPAGSVIQIEGVFDNSAANPRNPNRPPIDVVWGEATTDDMLILFLALTQDGQDLTRPGARNTFMEEFFQSKPTVKSDRPAE